MYEARSAPRNAPKSVGRMFRVMDAAAKRVKASRRHQIMANRAAVAANVPLPPDDTIEWHLDMDDT